MSGYLFKTIFIGLFFFKFIVKLGLDFINYSHLKKNASKIPAEIKTILNPEKLLESNSYNTEKIAFRAICFSLTSILLFIFLFSPLYPNYTNWVALLPLPYFLRGLLFFIILNGIIWLLDLPFNYYFHFYIEARYGYNKYTFSGWLVDEIKNLMVSIVFSVVILGVIFGIWGDSFVFKWKDVLLGWAISFVLVALLMYLVPILLIPFFYKLKAVENAALRLNIEELVKKSGFKVRGIFQADESNKSSHANALISGIGKSKTIILFDTLLNHYTEAEILAIIAHEIGHGKKGHLFKLMSLTILELFLFILFASYLLSASFSYQAMGITKNLYSGAFFVYILFFDLLTFFVQPLFSSISRVMEYEADDFSKQALGTGEPLISAFQKFITNELENINPHPLYEAYYYSHPTLIKRIQSLNKSRK